MQALQAARHVHGVCVDRDFDMIVACMRKGLPALQLDADRGLSLIADDAFDCVLLNQTIQQLHSALSTVAQMLRIAPAAVIGFPNFAYYQYRLSVALRGQLPVSETLPFEWYDTPNIHLVTLKDFRELCHKRGIAIHDLACLSETFLGRLLLALGFPNAGAERVLTRIARAAD
jgi:homoserine O-acetyltransferase